MKTIELAETMKEAIKTLDNHIARNPMAVSELPELRAKLSKRLAEYQKVIVSNLTA